MNQTSTISPARMARIWEKEPGLRPGGLAFHDDWSSYHHGNAWGLQRHYILPEVAARLIFAECVLWLAKDGEPPELSHWSEDNMYRVYLNGWDPDRKTPGCDDPTLAAVMACERVLGLPAWEEPK